ncbi:O-methyltransferase aurJ [Erysiphe neolycopersici]|uniref:O-methyltransferase aurJ n=1 Tax=Erysiphe neolycopersici TaxID=212602 RepID=A0A420HU82_9PEZI|nr:O-methyltransferase aurJ [Erysiphe neolycopersici]
MSLTVLATQILEAAKVIDQELDKTNKEVVSSPVKSSFINKISRKSRRLSRALGLCLGSPFRRNVNSENGNRIDSPIRKSDDTTYKFSELSDFERYNQLPENLDPVKNSLVDKCHQLRTLVETPETAIINIFTNWTEFVSLEAVCHFRLFDAIPPLGSATYAQIAAASQIPQDLVFRFIRICIINGIFCEPIPGHVHHTPRSRWLLTRGPGLLDLIAVNYFELAPAGLRYVEAIEKYNVIEEPTQCPFALANDNLPIYEALGRDEQRRLRFGQSMQYLTSGDGYNLRYILSSYDWARIDTAGARLLDVGGGLGHISAYIAAHTKELHFVVQDLPDVATEASARKSSLVDTHLLDRITFLPLSFFTPHSSSTPKFDVILLRWITHNWSDKYTRQIMRAIIPALKKGGQVFIAEYLLSEESPGVTATQTIGLRMDMIMGVGFSAKERTAGDLRILLEEVAQEFGGSWSNWAVTRPEGSAISFIRVVWNGD